MKTQLAKSIGYSPCLALNLVPPQTARPPLRVPRNKTGAMLLIQQLATRGCRYWTRGVVSYDRLPDFVTKMDTKFGVLDPQSRRTKKHTQGIATGRLVVWRQPETDRWLWWLLIAGRPAAVAKLSEQQREKFLDRENTPIEWTDEYILRTGPRGSLTWWMQRSLGNAVDAELRYLASAHGRANERTDNLHQAVLRARARPMFAGVRRQVGASLWKSWRRWHKTHRYEPWPSSTEPLAIMGRGMRVYDDPPDVVVVPISTK